MNELHCEVISKLSEIGRVLIIGGVIRDLAFFGADERPTSDIDFVVCGRVRLLDKLAQQLNAEPNRFGGFGLIRDGYKVDFWSLHNTWAKKQKLANVNNAKDLVKTTFFDWDAIVYDIQSSDIWAIPGYIDRLNKRTLEINLLPNPSIQGNMIRAMRRLVMWDARPGRLLVSFLEANLNDLVWDEVLAAESKAFHIRYLNQFSGVPEFRRKVLSRRSGYTAGVDNRRQQSFYFA